MTDLSAKNTDLTDVDKEVIRLRDEQKLTWKKIGEIRCCRGDTCRKLYLKAHNKLKLSQQIGVRGKAGTTETPKQAATAIDMLTDDKFDLAKISQACGVPLSVVKGLRRRLKTRWQAVDGKVRKIKIEQLLEMLDDKAIRCLEFLDDFALAGSSAKDLAVTFAVLTDKSLLLRGQPTQIISHEERLSLNVLMPSLVREIQSRGLTIDMKQLKDGSYAPPET